MHPARRLLLFLATLLFLAVLVAACETDETDETAEDAEDEEIGTINFYSPETPDMTERMAERFEEEVGGNVTVTGGGTGEIVAQLEAERDNPQADLWYGGGGWMPFEAVKEDGLLEPYTPEPVADLEEFDGDVWMREEDWYWTGADIFILGLSYNTEMVSEDELPETWADLADDRWVDDFQMPNPAASGTATLFVISQIMDQGEEAGWEYFDTIVDNVQAIPDSGAGPTQAVGGGEASLGVAFEFMPYQHQDRGEPTEFHIPEETPVLVNPVAKVADGPNPEGAEMFIDWMLSPEGQQARAEFFHLTISDEIEHEIPITLDDALDHAMDLDPAFVQDNFDAIRDEWRQRY